MKPEMTRGFQLRFSPYAWAKLLYMRDKGDTEIGGYGITSTEDPLLVTDFLLVKQECTGASVELDEDDSQRFFEEMLDCGLVPWQFQNIWIHTHPGNCSQPSTKDEEIFDRYFSQPNWAVFFILASGGDEYCRIRHNVGPGVEVTLDIEIDYGVECEAINFEAWEKEYTKFVTESKWGNNIDLLGDNKLYNDLHKLPSHYRKTETIADKNNNNDDVGQQLRGKYLIESDECATEDDEIYYDIDDGCVWYWDQENVQYVKYHVETDRFYDHDDMSLDYADPEPDCFDEIREWAVTNITKEGELLSDTADFQLAKE